METSTSQPTSDETDSTDIRTHRLRSLLIVLGAFLGAPVHMLLTTVGGMDPYLAVSVTVVVITVAVMTLIQTFVK